MTPTKKILLAAAFVAAGYGVASQLGAPKLQIIGRPQPLADRAPAPKPENRTALPSLSSDTRARLVPDVQAPAASAASDSNLEDVNDQLPSRGQSEFELASVSAPPLANSRATELSVKTHFLPRATLRNEAPRPLVIEPRDAITVKDIPQPAPLGAELAHAAAPPGSTTDSAPSIVSHAQFSQDRVRSEDPGPTAGIVAEDQVTPDAYYTRLLPANEELENQSQSHIVVDGDSLAKLAHRYLDDPQRASEIYELNRHVLSHPDVLPIGAQLMIPSRSVSLHSVGQLPQSRLPHGAAIHAASRGGLVPVRPIPPGATVMPRAHLAQPKPVASGPRVP